MSSVGVPNRTLTIPESGVVYLDGVRALAANLVVVAHVNLLYLDGQSHFQGGSIAVVLFFLLSGFLITWSAANKAADSVGFASFTADRIARIATPYVPALLLAVGLNASWISGQYGQPGLNEGALAFIGNLLFLQDYPLFQALEIAGIEASWRIRPYQAAEPFWTVAVEFWIYIAFGLFSFVLLRRALVRPAAMWVLLLLSVPVALWHLGGGAGKALSLVWCVGSVACVLLQSAVARMTPAAVRRAGLIFGTLAVIAIAARVKKYGLQDYDFQVACLLGIVLFAGLMMLWWPQSSPGPIGTTIKHLAAYSYSLYLVHNLILILFLEHPMLPSEAGNIAMAVVCTHVVSIAMYLAFERHHKKVSRAIAPRLAALLAPRRARLK